MLNPIHAFVASRALLLVAFAFLIFSCNAQQRKPAKAPKGYGDASYTLPMGNESFLRTWLIAGPVHISQGQTNPSEELQRNSFREDVTLPSVAVGKTIVAMTIGGKQYAWQTVKSADDVVDLDKHFGEPDFVAAFALAELRSDKALNTFLGVGSDDAIRIWVNGELVHDKWLGRAVSKDSDLVPIKLRAGSNQLLLRVQDMQQGWGFTVRVLNAEKLADHLISAAGKGDVDQVGLLIDAGARLDHKNSSGLTALNNARLSGREEVVSLLLEKGATESPMPPPAQLIDGLYSSLNGKSSAGVAVLVAKDGKMIYNKGFGYANLEQKQAVTPDTKFRIGSITKQFTSAAILKLQEANKISVNDKLSKFLPDFPRADEVTIHHLLTHTSGIHSYTSKPEFLEKVTAPVTEEDVIAFFRDDPYDFNPGENWLYNNSAYFLLGHIIGKVTGKSYGEYLKETFFKPLGMHNTGIHAPGLGLSQEAKGYSRDGEAYVLASDWNMSWAGGAGALYSTTGDLHIWNEAVFSGRVLSPSSLEAAFTPVKLNNGKLPGNSSYGYGWAISNYRGQPVIEHGGGLHGFLSQLARYPKENTTIVILSNLTPPEVQLSPNIIAEYLLWDKMDKQESRKVNLDISEDVTPYTGRYEFPGGAVMLITAEGNNLFAQLTGQPKFPIFPSGDATYFWKVVNAKITFVRNAAGEVEYGDFEQNGNKLRVPRIKDRPIVPVDKNLYKRYTGTYDFGNNMTIVISTEEDRIYVQATGQPKFELFPVSEVEFMVREVQATLQFVPEADGKVNKFILDMAGQKREIVRLN